MQIPYVPAWLSTVIVIGLPFLLPRLVSLVFSSRRAPAPAHQQATTSPFPPPPMSTRLIHLLLLSLSLTLCFINAISQPQNLFLLLAQPQSTLQRIFPALRTPLDIRLPSDFLTRLSSSSSSPSTPHPQLHLLTTLESRLLYTLVGPAALLNCSWCKPLSKLDYLAYITPGLLGSYLAVAGVLGVLTGRHTGRSWARKWVMGALIGGLFWEGWMRLKGGTLGGGKVVMVCSMLLSSSLERSF